VQYALRANINIFHRHTQKKNNVNHMQTHITPIETNRLLMAKSSQHHTAMHSNTQQHIETHGNTRQTHSNTRQHTAKAKYNHNDTTLLKTYAGVLPQISLRRTVTRCSTLQHIATQHFATLTLPCCLQLRRPSTARTILSASPVSRFVAVYVNV